MTQKRGRLCVSVKAGRQGELPRGSVKMGTSRTGATIYMEPATLLELNNAVTRLQAQEEEAEHAVLTRLTHLLAKESTYLSQVIFRAFLSLLQSPVSLVFRQSKLFSIRQHQPGFTKFCQILQYAFAHKTQRSMICHSDRS